MLASDTQEDGQLLSGVFEFWRTFARLFTARQAVLATMDIPLASAVRRSRAFTAWVTLLLAIGLCVGHPAYLQQSEVGLGGLSGFTGAAKTASPVLWAMWAAAVVVGLTITAIVQYGLLRLYTLLHHVLTLNVFKTRGQRLRLLNVETTLLVLSVPVALALALWPYVRIASFVILAIVLAYGLSALANAYNHIFHQHGVRGLWLLLEGTVLTWFVLSVVAIAVAAAMGVVVLILVLILRGFVHAHP